jgi:hypothetical protein
VRELPRKQNPAQNTGASNDELFADYDHFFAGVTSSYSRWHAESRCRLNHGAGRMTLLFFTTSGRILAQLLSQGCPMDAEHFGGLSTVLSGSR